MAARAATSRPPIEGYDDDARSVLYFLLFPNTLVSLHPDYVMLHTLWPRAADRTEVVCEWFFEPRRSRPTGFDPSDAVEFWDQVNREDWHVCTLTQQGMGSAASSPAATRARRTTCTPSTYGRRALPRGASARV